jgi:hypothetical protein
MRIAAYEQGFAVWGIGDTQEQAEAEARGTANDYGVSDGELALLFAPISEELETICVHHDSLCIHSDDVPFNLIDGVLHLTAPDQPSPDNDE